jgi:hypothetical protein
MDSIPWVHHLREEGSLDYEGRLVGLQVYLKFNMIIHCHIMLTEPTHCDLWITWRGLQCEAALGLVHPEESTLQTVLIHEDCVVVEVVTVYSIFVD